MRYFKFFIALFLFVTACKQQIKYPAGGFSYPKEINPQDSDFYIYPYIDSFSGLDSLEQVDFGRYFLKSFHEPNLSTSPQEKSVFRLIFMGRYLSDYIVINVTENRIVVKQPLKGWIYSVYKRENLSEYDRKLLSETEWYFRMKERVNALLYKSYMDSLFQLFPKLGDVSAYKKLLDKVAEYKPFQYSTKIIPTKKSLFDNLVLSINQSGFWNMPINSDCENIPTDASEFILEANTPKKYKVIRSFSCSNDNRKFTIACQEIIKRAGLEKQIELIWDGTMDSTLFDIPEVPLGEVHQ